MIERDRENDSLLIKSLKGMFISFRKTFATSRSLRKMTETTSDQSDSRILSERIEARGIAVIYSLHNVKSK